MKTRNYKRSKWTWIKMQCTRFNEPLSRQQKFQTRIGNTLSDPKIHEMDDTQMSLNKQYYYILQPWNHQLTLR